MAFGLSLALSSPALALSVTDPFTGFFSFGDSLTDDGKLGQLAPPSLEGRFSNGPTYAEIIADEFEANGHGTGNLALGGATAGDVNLSPILGAPLNTFQDQINVFANALGTNTGLITGLLPAPTFDPEPPTTGSNPLLSVFFGANDLFQAFAVSAANQFDEIQTAAFVGGAAFAAADAVEAGIRALNALNTTVFDDFVVVSLPDLGVTPAFLGNAGASAVTDAFNFRLTQNLLELNNDGINVIGFDPNGILDEIIEGVEAGEAPFGITDATTPCRASFSDPTGPSCLDFGIDPNTLLFGDAVHPNAVAQALLAGELSGLIEIAPVPLPATLPLFLVALGGMGIVARRRRA